MAQLLTGIIGAKRQTVKRASPRSLLKTLMEQEPGADEKTLLRHLRQQVEESDDREEYEDAIWEYWFANNYRAISGPTERLALAPVKTERVEQIKVEMKRRMTALILMDLVLPNGKALRDCTGRDCAKAGGWLARVATQIGPNELVGKALSEAEVRKLYQSAA